MSTLRIFAIFYHQEFLIYSPSGSNSSSSASSNRNGNGSSNTSNTGEDIRFSEEKAIVVWSHFAPSFPAVLVNLSQTEEDGNGLVAKYRAEILMMGAVRNILKIIKELGNILMGAVRTYSEIFWR
jgi:hypothetical protein